MKKTKILSAVLGSIAEGARSVSPAAQKASGQGSAPVSGADDPSLIRQTVLNSLLKNALGASSVSADRAANMSRLYDDYFGLYTASAASAAENAYGLAAAKTGGYGNSYASSAANAAFDSYMRGLSDRYLELEELSQNAESLELRRAADQAGTLYKLLGLLDDEAETAAAQTETERKNRLDFALKAADAGDYYYLNALGIDTKKLEKDDKLAAALTAAKYGDYKGLSALGVDTSAARYADLLKNASTLASFGDFAGLEALGVDVTALKENALLERALALAKYGDYSLLGAFSENAGAMKEKIGVTIQKGAEAAYAYGGYSYLVRYLDRQVGYGQLTEAGKRQILSVLTG